MLSVSFCSLDVQHSVLQLYVDYFEQVSESVKKVQKESAEKGQKKSNKKGKHTNHTKVLSLIIIDKDLDLSLQAQNL